MTSSANPAPPADGHPGWQPRLLTTAEVARLLAVSTRTVQRLVAAGKLPAVRLGVRLLRFDRDRIELWLRRLGAGVPRRR